MVNGVLWAASAPGSTTSVDITQLINYAQYGLLGLFFVLILLKKFIVPAYTLTDLKESHERELKFKDDIIDSLRKDVVELKDGVADLQKLTSDKMIPALVQANTLSAAYVQELARRGNSGP